MSDFFRTLPATAPPAPRVLSADMRADAAVFGRFLRLFGGIWAFIGWSLAFLFSLLAIELPHLGWGSVLAGAFGVAGLLLWMIGRAQRALAERVFRDGAEVSGEVVRVFRDHAVRMNGKNPFRVVYTFMAEGKPRSGTATFWDDEPPRVEVGERVTILHAPSSPSRSVLWTRIERGSAPAVTTPLLRVDAPGPRVLESGSAESASAESEALDEVAELEARRRSAIARDEER
jgi:hypothetical protein